MADLNFNEEQFYKQAKKDGVTHVSTGIAIVRSDKILMARRADGDFLGGNYELPGGGVDKGETIVEGAIREVKEETGLVVSKILDVFEGFDYTTDRKPHVRQVNFIVAVEPGNVVLDSNEHDAYLWIDISNIDEVKMSANMKDCVKKALEIIKRG